GLSYFWPADIYQWEMKNQQGERYTLIGEIYDKEEVPTERLLAAGHKFDSEVGENVIRYLVKTGNREFVGLDFRWILATDIISRSKPENIAVIERSKNGDFYGFPVAIIEDGKRLSSQNVEADFESHIERAVKLNDEALALQKSVIGSINYELENLRLQSRRYELDNALTDSRKAEIAAERAKLNAEYQIVEKEFFAFKTEAGRDSVIIRDMRGEEVTLKLDTILDVTYANRLGVMGKIGQWFIGVGK
ncbi:phosphate ABC transporter permease PstA, partial [Shewanella sp. 0m-11]